MPEPVRGALPPPPVSMAAARPPVGAADLVQRRAQEPPADEWARYAAAGGRQLAASAPPVDAAAASAAPVGVYAPGGSPQHAAAAPPNGDTAPEEADTSNRNSMGFQITSITQSSAEPDADPIDESGDEDVSDTAESSRTTAEGAGLSVATVDADVTAVDGLPGRLLLPLASTPRELTASPGVTGSEVLPVIPTIDGFGITLVPGALESVDAHGAAEIVEFPSEIEMDLMPTGLTVGVAPGSPGDDLQETWQSRFKVVKIETNVPFKRGRWQCMDYMDQPEAAPAPAPHDGSASAASSAHSSVQLTAGEPEPQPQPAASEEALLPGLAEDIGARREAPRVNVATPEPTAAAPAAQPSVSVPHQASAATGLPPGRDAAAAASAPNVHAVTADRGVTLTVGGAPSAAGLARQPATPEEARLVTDGVPVLGAVEPGRAPAGLTLPDLLPNSSLLELVQASVAVEQEGAAGSTSPGSSGAVDKVEPIDNKIEQAMDLVKSHLLLAVREEVDVLKANISKLVDKISVLERENEVLKTNATPHVLAQLETAPSLAPLPPTPAAVVAAPAAAGPPAAVAPGPTGLAAGLQSQPPGPAPAP